MFLTYQKYLLSIETGDIKELDSDLEFDDWDQYFDIETEMIINYKNKYIILKPCIQFRQLPAFKIKNQKQNQKSNLNIDILESIKEEEDSEIFEDIETGKIETNKTNKTNTNIYLYLINLQNIIVTLVFYISHVAFIVFLFRV